MNDSFRFFPESASKAARAVDALSLTLLGIATVFSVGICVSIIFFIARYWHTRRVNRELTRSVVMQWIVELTWTLGPLAILMFVFLWGAAVYVDAHQPPQNAVEINVVAKQWMWKVAHESGPREINALHIPVGRPVRLTMISEDVIHSFYVPAFRTKQDVLPGRFTTLWFEAVKPGNYHLFCAEYCGTEHSKMIGRVFVQSPDEYASWIESLSVETQSQRGRRWVESFGCLRCHARMNEVQIGPPLNGLVGSDVMLADGNRRQVDAEYLRTAMIDPQAESRAGYSKSMPSYDGQLSADQIMDIIAYLRSIADTSGPLAGPGVELSIQKSRQVQEKSGGDE